MKRFLALGLIVLIFIAACGKKEVKKVSPDSALTIEAFTVAEKIREAYLNNDLAALEKLSTRDGYRSVIRAKKIYDSAELTFVPTLVEIYGDTVHLYISWNGTWKKGGNVTEDRGLTVFVLKEKPLKLDEMLRTNPFSKPD